ncbi:hypothetical protein HNQ77_004494 [Silvibacterium bohemicum]|uniref:DinB-like domain-containing protein n=1 Tax=Silvibacterium bohemicum TaxID=1577686 RepID=A0A841K0L0_9BACT|nr:DinB family protein [Silvibacterium bohemicum]MBB6146515.1 hypothetical protein [Silvibacterium bohemicum]
MVTKLQETLALLDRTPATLNSLLRDLPESWTARNEGGETWTVFDVLGHLVYGERADWVGRGRMIREFGESRSFDPFDRLGFRRETEGRTLAQLLDEFARLRTANLEEVRGWNLIPADLDRKGRHPAFGPVSLSELLSAWAVHDLTHLHQISRIMAYQYRDAVGPWSAYLGVLHCCGHGA